MRWASPVVYMRRRVTEDTELSGVKLAAGDKVSMWYCSANRDEDQVRQPVDVRRDARPQSPFRLRWRRHALLPGRQPGAARDRGRVRRATPPDTRPRRNRGAGAVVVPVHPRHQAAAGRVDAAELTGCQPCGARAAGCGPSAVGRGHRGHLDRGDTVCCRRTGAFRFAAGSAGCAALVQLSINATRAIGRIF